MTVHQHVDTVYGIEIRVAEGHTYDECVKAVAAMPAGQRKTGRDAVAHLERLGLATGGRDLNRPVEC